jgi:hypothetical protein
MKIFMACDPIKYCQDDELYERDVGILCSTRREGDI